VDYSPENDEDLVTRRTHREDIDLIPARGGMGDDIVAPKAKFSELDFGEDARDLLPRAGVQENNTREAGGVNVHETHTDVLVDRLLSPVLEAVDVELSFQVRSIS